MYPIKNQLNFYLDEYDKYEGYITLKKGRKDLFIDDNYFVLWQSDKDSIVSEYYGYDDDSKTFKFRIPNSLDTATIYTFSVVQQTNKNVLISYRFRTSFYKTLKEKIDNADVILSINDSVFDNKQYRIASYLRMNENFDIVEIKGFKGMSKLVNVELNHENNEWFDVLDWLMYDAYPIDDKLVITWRDTEQLGIPPYKDVWIEQDKLLSLEGDNIKYILSQLTDYYNSPSIKSDCSYTASRDFRELLNKYSSHSLHNSNIHMQRIITNTFPDVGLYIGRFEEKDEFYKLTYILPGKGIPTSIYILSTNVF